MIFAFSRKYKKSFSFQPYRNADAGLTRRTNGKTNDAGLTFLRHYGISAFIFFNLKQNGGAASFLRGSMLGKTFKGAVSRDVRHSGFFVKQSTLAL
jgi:hypothetical protein